MSASPGVEITIQTPSLTTQQHVPSTCGSQITQPAGISSSPRLQVTTLRAWDRVNPSIPASKISDTPRLLALAPARSKLTQLPSIKDLILTQFQAWEPQDSDTVSPMDLRCSQHTRMTASSSLPIPTTRGFRHTHLPHPYLPSEIRPNSQSQILEVSNSQPPSFQVLVNSQTDPFTCHSAP